MADNHKDIIFGNVPSPVSSPRMSPKMPAQPSTIGDPSALRLPRSRGAIDSDSIDPREVSTHSAANSAQTPGTKAARAPESQAATEGQAEMGQTDGSKEGPQVLRGMMVRLLDNLSKRTIRAGGGRSLPTCGPFMEPVDAVDFPDYADVILHPMDLSTMRSNIQNGVYDFPASPLDMHKVCHTPTLLSPLLPPAFLPQVLHRLITLVVYWTQLFFLTQWGRRVACCPFTAASC